MHLLYIFSYLQPDNFDHFHVFITQKTILSAFYDIFLALQAIVATDKTLCVARFMMLHRTLDNIEPRSISG